MHESAEQGDRNLQILHKYKHAFSWRNQHEINTVFSLFGHIDALTQSS